MVFSSHLHAIPPASAAAPQVPVTPPTPQASEVTQAALGPYSPSQTGGEDATIFTPINFTGSTGTSTLRQDQQRTKQVGRRTLRADIVTPAGIRQAFPMGRPSKQRSGAVTDRGPQCWWLHKVGRAEDPVCGLCEEGIAQNAAHLLSCAGVADEKGRRW
ncbi:hypothetical protein EV426DRAFT_702368 [Tirmania nivea]|nr:hypothetical protein EV426DRAFT_702368 [Tirmania nivea]